MAPAPLLFLRVIRKRSETADICSFELAAADGRALPPFTAGAHIDVHLPGGGIRQYSLCNGPADRYRYVIAVLRDPNSRGGSVTMHDRLNEGDAVWVSAPRNHFPLNAAARRSLLLAGGIGVTPILAMAKELHAAGADFEVHYCTRTAARTAFREFLAAAPFASRVIHHFDDGPEAQKLDLTRVLAESDRATHLYVCGPAAFIDYVKRTAEALQWSPDCVHSESFSAQVAQNAGDAAFEVELVRSGRVYAIPAGRSALHVLLEQGVEVPWSCEQGICGACLTPVLEGIPDHRDSFLTEEERARNDQFTPCCSRAKSARLKLDL